MRLLILSFLLSGLLLFADQSDTSVKLLPFVTAVKTSEHINIDGILDEEVWQGKPSVDFFIQRDPVEGVEPSQKTVVYIAYDDDALYVAARMYDTHPDSIIARLTRRDNYIASDYLIFGLDPYRDKRSGLFFQINAAGTLSDGVLYNDDWSDNSWDAVWEGKARIDDKGWTVEIRIPFSQIGFKNDDHQVWGINIKRFIARNNEEDTRSEREALLLHHNQVGDNWYEEDPYYAEPVREGPDRRPFIPALHWESFNLL